jgi:uncharacterized membrane protein YkoI
MKHRTLWVGLAGLGAAAVVGSGIAVAVADPFDDDERVSQSERDRAVAAALDITGGGRVTDVEISDDWGHRYEVEVRLDSGREVDIELDERFELVAGRGQTHGPAPTGSAAPSGEDVPLTGPERSAAEAAALAEVGPGTVTDIDRSDSPGHVYEVEVRLADGTDVEVELAADFAVVGVDYDD